MTAQQKTKNSQAISPIENSKLFQACEINDTRKSYNKLWVNVKEEALEIVDRMGGSIINKYKNKSYYIEASRKNTKRFDVKAFQEKHPHLYNKFIVDGEAVELKTKIVK